jgi:uncharacterized protein (DUF433 family)
MLRAEAVPTPVPCRLADAAIRLGGNGTARHAPGLKSAAAASRGPRPPSEPAPCGPSRDNRCGPGNHAQAVAPLIGMLLALAGDALESEQTQAGEAGEWGMTKALGRYIVADPAICHGKPTFVGTRILVADVLEQVANGIAWEAIVDDWRGDVSKEAIAEAVRLAREVLLAHEHELVAG